LQPPHKSEPQRQDIPDFASARDDRNGDSDHRNSSKMCTAPIKSPPPTCWTPSCRPTNSVKELKVHGVTVLPDTGGVCIRQWWDQYSSRRRRRRRRFISPKAKT